jgi:hypothetical protein
MPTLGGGGGTCMKLFDCIFKTVIKGQRTSQRVYSQFAHNENDACKWAAWSTN